MCVIFWYNQVTGRGWDILPTYQKTTTLFMCRWVGIRFYSLVKGVIPIFKVTVNSSKIKFIDILLETEYFAALCGFEYPDGKLSKDNKSARLYLEADIKKDKKDSRVQYGLMVWHNTNYVPEIELSRTNDGIQFEITNEYSLPYPAIQRTEAWLEALKDHLRNKLNGTERIDQSKRIFLRKITKQ